ncbi:MAG TPA: TonB-dependent receptor [Steroidobacteraceae bacterium]|nr:TonB-dependent receptor [Steroidobacteraceae bacterium]
MKTKREKALPFKKSTYLFTIVGGAVLLNPAFAADNASTGASDNGDLEEIVITGIKASLKASMETKKDAVGVVDAINSEDIGKFPDTNLSEALQRVTGISIDRRNGEGATVTARGFGPQYNIVTLNGRQVPGSDGFGSGDAITGGQGNGSRSFNFANLAAESISAVEVYKTSRADISSGGMGATINIKTARPLDAANTGFSGSVGAKMDHDTTRNFRGDYLTPELSGIFSFTNDSKTFGIGLTASYQRRDSGSVESTVNDWHIQAWDANNILNNVKAGPFAGTFDAQGNPTAMTATIVNAPKNGQLYGIPNDIRYAFNDFKRERLNGQLTVQVAPVDGLVLTADYTYAQNKLEGNRGEQTIWMQRNGFTKAVFDTNEAVATPVVLDELTGTGKDFGYEQQKSMQKNTLGSLGFNADWKITDSFRLIFDISDSKAKSLPNDPITNGSNTSFSLAGQVPSTCLASHDVTDPLTNKVTTICDNGTNFWRQTFYFNNDLPVAARTLYANTVDANSNTGGDPYYAFGGSSLGSQVLRTWYTSQISDMKQAKLDGEWKFADKDKFQFGIDTQKMEMDQKNGNTYNALGDWGVADAGKVPSMVALTTPISISALFHGHNVAGIPKTAYMGDADVLGTWAATPKAMGGGGYLSAMPWYDPNNDTQFSTINMIEEKTNAAYAQVNLNWDMGSVNANLLVGGRYEKTDVTSTSIVNKPDYLLWQDDNDFQVHYSGTLITITKDGSYNNFLPNLNLDLRFTNALTGRIAYSQTIARPEYGNLVAAPVVNTPGGSTFNGFQAGASEGDPALLPLKANNIDLSLEYYFSDTGYVSVGFFNKKVKNFIGNSIVDKPEYGIKDQTANTPNSDAAQAITYLQNNGFQTNDSALFTAIAMLQNTGTFTDTKGTWTGGLTNYTGQPDQHIAFATKYDVIPNAGDTTDYTFAVSTPVNNKDATIHGFEVGGQIFLGDTGVGLQANYTIVRGDVSFDNTGDPNVNQFALLGLSDSANGVLMYEKYGINARLAYNWRDKFLSNINQGGFRNPVYVAPHQQWDLSVGYDLNKHVSFSFEGINLTNEGIRWYGRSEKQLWRLEDDGARYAIGARYKF